MNSDIKLENNKVTIEGFRLKHMGGDFELDYSPRRIEHSRSTRRALVHDYNDGLTINWLEDYPGGVTINGEVKCTDILESRRLVVMHHFGVSDDGSFSVGGRSEFKQPPTLPDLLITELGTVDQGDRIPFLNPASLVEIIRELRETIEQLEERVQLLETRS